MPTETSVDRSTSQINLMLGLLREYPQYNAQSALERYKKKYNKEVYDSVYYKARKLLKEESQQTQPIKQAPPIPYFNETVVISDPTPQAFIPPSLIENISRINEVCANAGGVDTVEAVAKAIDQIGGVSNFLEVVGLIKIFLRKREGETLSLPAEVNARL